MTAILFLFLSYFAVLVHSQCKATCFDGIKNQDETGIDCGGTICEACAFPVNAEVPLITQAICSMTPTLTEPNQDLVGRFEFAPDPNNNYDPLEPSVLTLNIDYAVTGLVPGDHKFHIHLWGDMSDPYGWAPEMHFVGVVATGSRNPSLPQEVGLLNGDTPIQTLDSGQAAGAFTDTQARLNSQNSILGRTMIVHGDGTGPADTSRAAQCAIGLKSVSGDIYVDDAPPITRAHCELHQTTNTNDHITGIVEFKLNAKNKVDTRIFITELDPTLAPYNIYVNEMGDISLKDASLTGAPFSGTITPAPAMNRFRIGELGNNILLYPDVNGVVSQWFTDGWIALNGQNSIVGRSVAVVFNASTASPVIVAIGVIGMTEGYGTPTGYWEPALLNPPPIIPANASLITRAVAFIQPTVNGTSNISGFISFDALANDHSLYPGGWVRVKYAITGLVPGSTHDLAIASLGDAGMTTGTVNGASFGPILPGFFLNNSRLLLGDFGNITADAYGFAQGILYDHYLMLNSYNSIVGHAVLIYSTDTSSASIAWGVIGIEEEEYDALVFDTPPVQSASCLLQPTATGGQPNFAGYVTITPASATSFTVVVNVTTALSGSYYMHVHNFGDIFDLQYANSVGPHFNGEMSPSSPRTGGSCEVGNLNNGNLLATPFPGVATFTDTFIRFSGLNSIIGRSLVIHNSSTWRVAQCVIGVKSSDTTYLPDTSQIPPPPAVTTTNECVGINCNHGTCNQETGICECNAKWGGPLCNVPDNAATSLSTSLSIIILALSSATATFYLM